MDVLLEKSLINCHCYGMDSLVLKDGPGMIRMFIARYDHQLFHNNPGLRDHTFTVAMHRHHCDVTLQPILGEVYDVLLAKNLSDSLTSLKHLRSYKYTSHILEGEKAGFKPVDEVGLWVPLRTERILEPRYMLAEELHSVYVPQGKPAAWYIWEGEENPHHNSIVYTDYPGITDIDFSVYDQPMTEERLEQDLRLIGVKSYSVK